MFADRDVRCSEQHWRWSVSLTSSRCCDSAARHVVRGAADQLQKEAFASELNWREGSETMVKRLSAPRTALATENSRLVRVKVQLFRPVYIIETRLLARAWKLADQSR